jgi:hypothetical protein
MFKSAAYPSIVFGSTTRFNIQCNQLNLYGKKLKSCSSKLCITFYIYTILFVLDSRFQTEIVMRESGSTVFCAQLLH